MRFFTPLLLGALAACSTQDPAGDAPTDDGSSDQLAAGTCHPLVPTNARGAYFRKVVSAENAKYAALGTSGTLPTVWFDGSRWFSTADSSLAYQNGPLDRPSVYLGGRASETEVDAGLTWDRVYDAEGRATWTDVAGSRTDGNDPAHRFTVDASGTVTSASGNVRAQKMEGLRENFAFRPYWRVGRRKTAALEARAFDRSVHRAGRQARGPRNPAAGRAEDVDPPGRHALDD